MALDKICSIHRAGYNPDKVAQLDLEAQDGTFGRTWFYSDTESARAILAVALAAITTGKGVECTVDDPATGSHGITGMWIVS
jgi:hypothetical protein